MKKINKKSLVLLICVTLLLTFTVSGTVAYLAAATDPVENVFTPAKVDTEIKETFESNSKTGIFIANKEDSIDAYVRVAIVANWVDANNNIVAPWTGPIRLNTSLPTASDIENGVANGQWVAGDDGYYYFTVPVKPGETTTNLLDASITQPSDKPAGADHLVINVIHQSIQADGMGVSNAVDAFAKADKK